VNTVKSLEKQKINSSLQRRNEQPNVIQIAHKNDYIAFSIILPCQAVDELRDGVASTWSTVVACISSNQVTYHPRALLRSWAG
jgi:hypothetical protein